MDEIDRYLEDVTVIIEATSFEKNELWKQNSASAAQSGWGKGQLAWRDNLSGYGPAIGEIGGKPIAISIFTATIDGEKVCFMEPTSKAVDHDVIEAWLREKCPKARRYAEGYTHIRDAGEFRNALAEAKEFRRLYAPRPVFA